jgi:hypothetical protein
MRNKLVVLIVIVELIFLSIPQRAALANIIPPSIPNLPFPPMSKIHFIFESDLDILSIEDISINICEDKNCIDYRDWGFLRSDLDFLIDIGMCTDNYCDFIGSFIGQMYYKLEIKFEDQSRMNNIFPNIIGEAYDSVKIIDNEIFIKQIPPSLFTDVIQPYFTACILPAIILTLITEYFIGWIYSKKTRTIVKNIIWANCITLPILWISYFFFAPRIFLNEHYIIFILLAEVFIFMFEAAFLFYTNRESGLTKRQAILVSFIANLSSIVVGLLGSGWYLCRSRSENETECDGGNGPHHCGGLNQSAARVRTRHLNPDFRL